MVLPLKIITNYNYINIITYIYIYLFTMSDIHTKFENLNNSQESLNILRDVNSRNMLKNFTSGHIYYMEFGQ